MSTTEKVMEVNGIGTAWTVWWVDGSDAVRYVVMVASGPVFTDVLWTLGCTLDDWKHAAQFALDQVNRELELEEGIPEDDGYDEAMPTYPRYNNCGERIE